MVDPEPLLNAVDRLAGTFRGLPRSRLDGAVPGFASRAEAGFALAAHLAELGQRLEAPGRPPVALWPAGPFAVGDQIAVVGHDLAAAAVAAGDGAVDAGPVADVLAVALREVTATARLVA